VQLAICDPHPRLQAAIAPVLGSPWQRCTVQFLKDLRGHCRTDQHDALGALICQLFSAPDGAKARRRLRDAIAQLEPRLPKIARLLKEAKADVLAFYAFAAEHWPKLRSTKSAGALQLRNRPQDRRRRHLPQRHLRHPSRRRSADRAERLS
jgi:putative transposase